MRVHFVDSRLVGVVQVIVKCCYWACSWSYWSWWLQHQWSPSSHGRYGRNARESEVLYAYLQLYQVSIP